MPRPVHAQPGEEVESKSVQWDSLPQANYTGITSWSEVGIAWKELFASEGQAGVAFSLRGCVSPVRVFESISALDCHSGPQLQRWLSYWLRCHKLVRSVWDQQSYRRRGANNWSIEANSLVRYRIFSTAASTNLQFSFIREIWRFIHCKQPTFITVGYSPHLSCCCSVSSSSTLRNNTAIFP